MLKPILGACSISAVLTVAAWAQAPAGPEFRVNTQTLGGQLFSSVASDANGNFVVVWAGVFGQRFNAAGVPLGAEFRVNSFTTGLQSEPHVASDPSGNFVVAWHKTYQPNPDFDAYARRFTAAGAPLGAEFRVNAFTTGNQGDPAVAFDASGNFVVAWHSEFQDGGGTGPPGQDFGVFARRYSAGGAPLGAEFQVNVYTTGEQAFPSVATDASGNFVVAWQSFNQDGHDRGVFARRFSAAGAPLGDEFKVNTYTFFLQARPWVASDAIGNFVVVWTSLYQDGPSYGVFGQRFSAAGAPLGSEFRVNTSTANHQYLPTVASEAGGDFVVVWQSPDGGGPGGPGGDSGVFGQRFSAAGAPLGGEFRVNTHTLREQRWPAVATQGIGKFVVTWDSDMQDGSSWGVFGQRYASVLPAALSVDDAVRPTSDGNRVFEPGETVDVAPTWRNASGATQSFGGTAGTFTGPGAPGDPGYSVVDGTASYGTIPDGTSASCTSTGDCYVLGISVPTARPVQHWDASVREALTPIPGQSTEWTLHVGDSFSDVPRSGGFYRFIETLLHHGVTGGCGGTSYCPGAATSREQMAVFVLVAKEGSGYLPPACVAGSEAFADVPASKPFCRWIEELARRAVVSGCGGGNYCPTNAVTREQMAVFVLRTLDSALSPPACTTPIYNDVPAASGFCRWIEDLTRRSVVTGCGGGNYCPTAAVTREQMGVFISATFGLTLYGP